MNKTVAIVAVLALLAAVVISVSSSPKSDQHWLLTKFGWDIKVKTKRGQETSVPFLSYDAAMAVIVGTCNGDFVKNVMKDQDLKPVLTEEGDGIITLWLVSYANSTGGPYDEFVVSIVSSTNPSVVSSDPLQLLHAFAFEPSNAVYLHKLWLSDQFPIDYGRDFLGTDKYPMTVTAAGRKDRVHVYDSTDASGNKLIEASISTSVSFFEQMSVTFGLLNTVGFRTSVEAMLAPTLYHLVTPKNITAGLQGNPHALLYGYSPNVVVANWDPSVDTMKLGKEFDAMQFVPKVKQLATEYTFAYFPPFIFLSF